MTGPFQRIDRFLRGEGEFGPDRAVTERLGDLLAFVLVFGIWYGAVMGTFSGLAPGRAYQLIYSGIKVPILLLVTFLLCLPSFFVVNSLLGLREDFGRAVQAVLASQACVALVLGCLSPLTAVFYLSSKDYNLALLFNGSMFAVASVSGLIVMRRYYRPLIQRESAHRTMLLAWLFFYVFVGIQMSWVLRPFVGDPHLPVTFFRQEAWGNAYVVVGELIASFVRKFCQALQGG
jgi:hypothetical protein